jgi:transcriptional regulator with XRE-family HTH domain
MTGTDRRFVKDGRRATGWSDYQLATILGVSRPSMSRWRSGLLYPDIRGLKKIEKVFGWPAAEQIDLIPLMGYDERWSLVFNRIIVEWREANPREVDVDSLGTEARTRRLDPSRPVGNRRGRRPGPPGLPPIQV